MKYNILGFYQQKAVELGLDSNDLLVLRWFVDYAGTSRMKTIIIDNKPYYWINYASVLEELPILNITKQTLARKHFGNLVKANVLDHKHITTGGSFSYYCYGINYDALVYLQTDERVCVKNTDPMSKNTEGYVKTDIGGMSKNTQQINNILNNNSIKYNKEKLYKEKVFIPPTLNEVMEYAKSQKAIELAQPFYDYFTAGNWVDSKGQKVKSWKQKFLTWVAFDKKEQVPKVYMQVPQQSTAIHQRTYTKKEFDNLFDDIENIEI